MAVVQKRHPILAIRLPGNGNWVLMAHAVKHMLSAFPALALSPPIPVRLAIYGLLGAASMLLSVALPVVQIAVPAVPAGTLPAKATAAAVSAEAAAAAVSAEAAAVNVVVPVVAILVFTVRIPLLCV